MPVLKALAVVLAVHSDAGTRMQSWRIWAGEDPHTKPLICRAKDKICFNVQAITKQGNMVVFCD